VLPPCGEWQIERCLQFVTESVLFEETEELPEVILVRLDVMVILHDDLIDKGELARFDQILHDPEFCSFYIQLEQVDWSPDVRGEAHSLQVRGPCLGRANALPKTGR